MVMLSGERANSVEDNVSEKVICCSPLELGIRHRLSMEMAVAGLGNFEARHEPTFGSEEPAEQDRLRVIQTGTDQENYELFEETTKQLRNQYLAHIIRDGYSIPQASMTIFRTIRTIVDVNKALKKDTSKEETSDNNSN